VLYWGKLPRYFYNINVLRFKLQASVTSYQSYPRKNPEVHA